VLQDQGGEVAILAEREQVLLVQRVDAVLRVLVDDAVRDEQRAALVSAANAVHRAAGGCQLRQERAGVEATHKQPGRHVTLPNSDSKALDRWWEM